MSADFGEGGTADDALGMGERRLSKADDLAAPAKPASEAPIGNGFGRQASDGFEAPD